MNAKQPEAYTPATRYRAVEGSESGHCCFTATVIDLAEPEMHSEGYWLGWYDRVCECFSIEDAKYIAEALNEKEVKDDSTRN